MPDVLQPVHQEILGPCQLLREDGEEITGSHARSCRREDMFVYALNTSHSSGLWPVVAGLQCARAIPPPAVRRDRMYVDMSQVDRPQWPIAGDVCGKAAQRALAKAYHGRCPDANAARRYDQGVGALDHLLLRLAGQRFTHNLLGYLYGEALRLDEPGWWLVVKPCI